MVRLFVTGTDTGVGKTYVSTALCREGVRRGWPVFGHKPIETGCRSAGGGRIAEDAIALAAASGGWQRGEALCQYMLEQPVAPSVAAKHEGVTIDVVGAVDTIRKLAGDRPLALVEGAGGWRVPITDGEDMASFALRLDWPVLIVARAGLGTINHSLLTAEMVEYDGCEVWGIALSQTPDDDPDLARSNRVEIAKRCRFPVWLAPAAAAILDRGASL